MSPMNRRAFLARGGAAAAVGMLAGRMAVAQDAPATPQVVIFSKYLQFMDYKTLARTCREIGLDGVDLTVRPGGHVLPENVDRDLTAAVEAIRAEGLSVPMISTNYYDLEGPNVTGVFARAAALGIPFVRVGVRRYDDDGPIAPQAAKFTEDLAALAKLAAESGLTLGYHKHSGWNNFGGPLWDLHQACAAVNSPHFGSNFDTAHTAAEGAFGVWQVNTRLLAPYVKMSSAKDFVWKGAEPEWVRLGQGVVKNVDMYRILRTLGGFSGPVSIHIEYRPKGGGKDGMVEEIRATVPILRGILKEAGYPA